MMIIGSVHNTVKLAQLQNKWQQKKENLGKKQMELTPEERQIEHFKEQMEDIREGNEYAAIGNKINSGEKLTPEEIAYLRRKNPQALQTYEEIQKEKENYKRQLKNCKTKEDVEKLKQMKMDEFMATAKKVDSNPHIPKEEKLAIFTKLLAKLKAVEEAHYEFVKSLAYQSMLTEEEKQQAEKADREQKLPEKLAENLPEVTEKEAEVLKQEQEEAEVLEQEETERPVQDKQSGESFADGIAPEKEPEEVFHDLQNIRHGIENIAKKYQASFKKVDVLA